MEGKYDIWVIDQACSVKMAGYWPSPLRNEASIILNEQPWSIEGLLLDNSLLFSRRTQRVIQSQRSINWLIVVAYGASFIIRTNKYLPSFST